MSVNLGDKVRDSVSGFKGIVTGLALYMGGTEKAEVTPTANRDGKYVDGVWFPVSRLEIEEPSSIGFTAPRWPRQSSNDPGKE